MIEGMLYYIEHQKIMNEDIVSNLEIQKSVEVNNVEDYGESKYQFCTECIVEGNEISRNTMKTQLNDMGDSFILAGTKNKVKIHIHTDAPNKVFDICSDFGQIKNQKADDMHQQVASSHGNQSDIAIVTDSGCDIQYDTHNSNIHIVPVKGFLDLYRLPHT